MHGVRVFKRDDVHLVGRSEMTTHPLNPHEVSNLRTRKHLYHLYIQYKTFLNAHTQCEREETVGVHCLCPAGHSEQKEKLH